MNPNSVVRWLDDLGRVGIPKEVREKLGIENGDPVEIIWYEETGTALIKRYGDPMIGRKDNND